jgi:hypothetical protein
MKEYARKNICTDRQPMGRIFQSEPQHITDIISYGHVLLNKDFEKLCNLIKV